MRTAKVVALGLLVGLLVGVGAWVDAGPTYDQIVLSDNPTAYWRFEEANTGLPAADSATGDGAQNGAYNGTAALVPGIVGQGLDVTPTGVGVGGGWVQAGGVNTAEQLTVEVWAKSDTANWNAFGWLASARVNDGFIVHSSPGGRTWQSYVLDSGGGFQQIGGQTPADIQGWHHYVVTYDESANTGVMYFDGVRVVRNGGMNRNRSASSTMTVWLGRDSTLGGADREGDGKLDEAAVYTSALNGVQVRKHYQAALGQPYFTGARFTGPGELDLDGIFPYAIDIGDTSGNTVATIGQATFTGENVAGFSISSDSLLGAWGTKPDYGSTPEDDALENMMHSIRYDSAGNVIQTAVQIDMDLPNLSFPYKLQLIFSENDPFLSSPGLRSFDITVEGVSLLDEFDTLEIQQAWSGTPAAGAVLTYEFWPTDSQLNILITNGSFYANRDTPINALTLEMVIPEPTTMTLLGLGALIAARRRRRK